MKFGDMVFVRCCEILPWGKRLDHRLSSWRGAVTLKEKSLCIESDPVTK